MELIEKYQKQLLDQTQLIYRETPISPATQQAYLATPRHRFVKRYREWATTEWREVTAQNLEEHLATLYADRPLILFGDNDQDVGSTISQPSFVLHMLDMLQIAPGQNIFELGTGSGWNAALMGNLVGPQGTIHSLEIIPQVAQTAAATLAELGISNVRVIEGDGGQGWLAGAPYDRAIFSAGAYDLPHFFFEQIRVGGLLLVVIKSEGGGDSLFLLRKAADHFESLDSQQCAFVQMKGSNHLDSLDPIQLESLPEWQELKEQPVGKRAFWWGTKGKDGFLWQTLGIRSFLSISEPRFQAFKTVRPDQPGPDEYFFGLWDREQHSLVLAKDDALLSYGNSLAEECLLKDVERWVRLGMPGAASLALKIYPLDVPLSAAADQWIVRRRESQFLWSL